MVLIPAAQSALVTALSNPLSEQRALKFGSLSVSDMARGLRAEKPVGLLPVSRWRCT